MEINRKVAARGGHGGDLALGEDHPYFLGAAVEILAVPWGAQIGVDHRGIHRGIGILEVHGLFDADVAAGTGTIGQVFATCVPLPGTLHKNHGFHFPAIRRPLYGPAVGCPGQRFQPRLINHVRRLAVAELGQLVGVVQLEAGGLHNRADVFSGNGAGLGSDIDHKAARRAVGLGHRGIQVNLDVGIRLYLRNQDPRRPHQPAP